MVSLGEFQRKVSFKQDIIKAKGKDSVKSVKKAKTVLQCQQYCKNPPKKLKKKGFVCKSFQFYEKSLSCKLLPVAITADKIKENNIKFVIGNVESEGNCNSFKFPWGFHLKDKIPDPKNKPECK